VVTPLLPLLEGGVNRALALDPESDAMLAPLAGKRVVLEIRGVPGTEVEVQFDAGRVRLQPPGEAPGDVRLSGTPVALLALLRQGEGLPAGTGVSVEGDVGLLAALSRALGRLRPDWEEPLSRILGDELGHPLARGIERVGRGVQRTVAALEADLAEFLREESGWLASSDRLREFADEVDAVRDAVERLEKRMQHLEQRR
jgi:ubiquinone biosynthesis protein UbiJ